jgi:hypothetical protein
LREGGDMSILRGLKLLQVFRVICVILISITLFYSNGYCEDDWGKVGSYENFTQYYNISSVQIDKHNNIITVWVKCVFTEKGKISYLDKVDSIYLPKYIKFDHTLLLYKLNYKEWKFSLQHINDYSKSDDLLFSGPVSANWEDIKPNSISETLFNKILKDYNIKR